MAIYKRGDTYWYEFRYNGERIQESAHTKNKTEAKQIEAAHRTRLVKEVPPKSPKRPKQGTGCVYFIETADGQFVKIGFSRNPQYRLRSLSTASAHGLKLLASIRGTMDHEMDLHYRFSADRDRGEWFRKSEPLMAFINTLNRGANPC